MTLQDWMNRGSTGRKATVTETPEPTPIEPKTNPWTTAPDSTWLAEWALVALGAGRIELGYQLSKLAVMAQRYEAGGGGQHRADPEPTAAAADDDAPEAELAPVIPGIGIATAPPAVTPNGRCIYATTPGAECHEVAFYDPGLSRWVHLDATTDRHHPPVIAMRPADLYGADAVAETRRIEQRS
jgi:hypothetical protein